MAEIVLEELYHPCNRGKFLPTKERAWHCSCGHFSFIGYRKKPIGSEISDFLPQRHAITSCETTSHKINAGKLHFSSSFKLTQASL